MIVKICTLIDITETNARRDDDVKKRNQQSNYMVFLQTAGLRVNPYPESIAVQTGNIDGLGFGTNFSGKQRYWEFVFSYEYEGGLSEEMLIQDFDLIPIITQLDETVAINNNVVRTQNTQEKNIIFNLVDNN